MATHESTETAVSNVFFERSLFILNKSSFKDTGMKSKNIQKTPTTTRKPKQTNKVTKPNKQTKNPHRNKN